MRKLLLATLLLSVSAAGAQEIEIISAHEEADAIVIVVQTDIETPFEVMAGFSLAGQDGDDVFIGNGARTTIETAEQSISIPKHVRGDPVPSGEFDAEISFYPNWGAVNSPESTQNISEPIQSTFRFQIIGSGESADSASERLDLRKWVMLNTVVGEPFSITTFRNRLGDSEAVVVENRNRHIVGHYFPKIDMTLFENTLQGTFVTWREGRVDEL